MSYTLTLSFASAADKSSNTFNSLSMKQNLYILFLFILIFESCAQESNKNGTKEANLALITEKHTIFKPQGTTLETRISPPQNYQRTPQTDGSYAYYLRNLPLKPHGSEVMYYDGRSKPNRNTYVAVVDMKIGTKNLHQCADAVMRFRAEYLWTQEQYKDIHFNFTNGFRVDYSKWMQGQRIVVKGNKSYWVDKQAPSNTYQDFWEYMEIIFNYAGTLSLSKELVPVDLANIDIGDVFIWGGSPGHAILVIDIAINPENNEKVFLLAQSYMPAQETQILQNPNNSALSPWYSVSEIAGQLNTPEWSFNVKDLKRFKD